MADLCFKRNVANHYFFTNLQKKLFGDIMQVLFLEIQLLPTGLG